MILQVLWGTRSGQRDCTLAVTAFAWKRAFAFTGSAWFLHLLGLDSFSFEGCTHPASAAARGGALCDGTQAIGKILRRCAADLPGAAAGGTGLLAGEGAASLSGAGGAGFAAGTLALHAGIEGGIGVAALLQIGIAREIMKANQGSPVSAREVAGSGLAVHLLACGCLVGRGGLVVLRGGFPT